MIFQFGIVALGLVCATILALLGQPEVAKFVAGASALVFLWSTL